MWLPGILPPHSAFAERRKFPAMLRVLLDIVGSGMEHPLVQGVGEHIDLNGFVSLGSVILDA